MKLLRIARAWGNSKFLKIFFSLFSPGQILTNSQFKPAKFQTPVSFSFQKLEAACLQQVCVAQVSLWAKQRDESALLHIRVLPSLWSNLSLWAAQQPAPEHPLRTRTSLTDCLQRWWFQKAWKTKYELLPNHLIWLPALLGQTHCPTQGNRHRGLWLLQK